MSPSTARMKASSAPYSNSDVSRKLARLKPVGVARPARLVLRPCQGGNHDDANASVGKLPDVAHRLADSPAVIVVSAGGPESLDVVQERSGPPHGRQPTTRRCAGRTVRDKNARRSASASRVSIPLAMASP